MDKNLSNTTNPEASKKNNFPFSFPRGESPEGERGLKRFGGASKQLGRKPKADPCRHRLAINLNNADYATFLSLYEASGLSDKARFITSCIFNRQLKVVKIDKAAMDYYMRLTTFHSQFRAIGVNYNQVVKAIKSTFSEKKALAFLYKLEQATRELIEINQKIIDLTAEFEQKHTSPKVL